MMKRLLMLILTLPIALGATAQTDFDTYFEDATLRLDYVFCGDAEHQAVYFQQACRSSAWAGRRQHLTEPLLKGNGQIIVRSKDGQIRYVNSFSTLFQEWKATPEATRHQRAFENCFQVPFPKETVEVEILLYDLRGAVSCSMRHTVDPADILIRRQQDNAYPRRTLQNGGDIAEAIDIVIVGDGYAAQDYVKFFADAERARVALMQHKPFSDYADRFSFRAVLAPSQQSGTSVPHDQQWLNTAFESHFDTFYSTRYLTTSSMQRIYDAVGTVPFEHLIVLVNTPVYGGGGIFNSVTIMGSDHPTFKPVLVHEFGHAFGGLADEYFYLTEESDQYPLDVEPWEPNITTQVDFASKWEDLLSEEVGLHEGAGYRAKGIYRPTPDCRMRTNQCEGFCPVCSRAIVRMIEYYTR